MYNRIVFIGRLTRDVELKYMQSGTAIATLNLASSRKGKKQDGSTYEETCFVDAKLFGRTAEVANQYLKKGSRVLIEGRLAYESWEQNGQKRSKHCIHAEELKMLDSKPQEQKSEVKSEIVSFKTSQQQQEPEIEVRDEDIPF